MSRHPTTDLGLKNLKPRAQEYEVSLGNKLYYSVQPTNGRSFAIRYRFPKGGRTRQLRFESGVSLAAARKLAADYCLMLEQGSDPAEAKRKARQEQRLATQDTLAAVVQEYLTREAAKLRTGGRRRRMLESIAATELGARPIGEIGRRDVVRFLDHVEDGHGASTTDNTLAVLRRLFNWYAARSDDFVSPIVRGMARLNSKDRVRTRILSDDELRAIVTTAEADGSVFALQVLFLLYTAARREEANGLRWSEIRSDVWVLPSSRNKVKTELSRPLGDAAKGVLAKLPRYPNCDLAFTSDGKHPFGGHSRRKKAFDRQCGVHGWTLHDLRRTSRSLLSRAGVRPDHAERVLGHLLPGIQAVYDQYRYLEEMRHAYAALESLIDRIAHPPADNVTALRG
jgi:integrase